MSASNDEDNDAAREGTCAAWVAELALNGDAQPDDMLGETHENGWTVDEDMVRHIQDYVDMIGARTGMVGQAEVALKHPHLPLAGTADHVGWRLESHPVTLFITDLKYGYKIVEPTSFQLTAYLMMVLSMIPADKIPDLIHLSIFQPRAIHSKGSYRKRVLSLADAQQEIQVMAAQIDRIMRGDVIATPGSPCMHCARNVSCEALTRSVYDLWDTIQSRAFHDPSPNQLSSELVMLSRMDELVSARLAAVQSEVESKISGGGFVPGWRLEDAYGKRKFTKPNEYIQMVTGVDPTDKKTCTPAELIRRGADEKTVNTITTKPYIGTKLKRFDEEDALAELNAMKGFTA